MIETFCGANLWCDWSFKAALRDRLWEYIGKGRINGIVVYQFISYKRQGHPMLLTIDDFYKMPSFKPFLITPSELVGGYLE